jgi:hypothetical protein
MNKFDEKLAQQKPLAASKTVSDRSLVGHAKDCAIS